MRNFAWLFLGAMVAVGGCDEGTSNPDASTQPDTGADPDAAAGDSGPPTDGGDDDAGALDGGPAPVDGGPLPIDAGPPEPCDSPGAIETVACGSCGTLERFCTAAGTWANGACEGEGVCAPGSVDSTSCGMCGSQASRCTIACVWEPTGACTGEGVCVPGATSRSGEGCAAGQTRDVLCSDACVFEPAGACASDGCAPGTIEDLACGMCGTQERFCNASAVWEYGACSGEGVCAPGTSGTGACGMCGETATRCTASCAWEATGACTGEGVCAPGTERRTTVGCPAGQSQLQRCGAACSYSTIEACSADLLVDVVVLLDVTGSHGARVRAQVAELRTRLIDPLLALGDVAVGVAYYADFPIDPYGDPGDRPFEGGIQPSLSASAIGAELATVPTMNGNDGPESLVEALSVLTGGARPASAVALSCSSGRTAGGCWRPGALRFVVVWTDAMSHNGPDPDSTALYSPYTGISPAPATWGTVRGRMTTQDLTFIALFHEPPPGSFLEPRTLRPQLDEMLGDLGQPVEDRIDATFSSTDGVAILRAAFDSAVARVRAHAGL